jgi:3-hydroxybutyryl-CoA dehydrogenase
LPQAVAERYAPRMNLDQIKKIAIIGLGRMGHGIAQTFAAAGYAVRGFDDDSTARSTVHDRIRRNLEVCAAHGLLKDEIDAVLDRVVVTDNEVAAVEGTDFAVEAIAEDLDVKQAWFARMEECVEETAILASNSSTFTISQSGAKMRLPHRAVVTHWFNPPHIVPTVEVVPGPLTAEETVETTVDLHRRIGKLAVRLNKEIPGFLVNRVQMALIREVWDLYERGIASPEDIDAAIRGSIGFRLATAGPLAICDFGGLDLWRTVYENLAPNIRSDAKTPAIIEELVQAGHRGAHTGRGVHTYDPGNVERVISTRDEQMLKLAKLLLSDENDS